MEARGKAEEAKDKADDAKEAQNNKSPPAASPSTPCTPATDGMTQLKEFFSGEQGLKRSEVFLKFAKMITEGDSPASSTLKPALVQVKKHKKKKSHKQKKELLQVES